MVDVCTYPNWIDYRCVNSLLTETTYRSSLYYNRLSYKHTLTSRTDMHWHQQVLTSRIENPYISGVDTVIALGTPDKVTESIEHSHEIRSLMPSRVKPMIYKVDTCHFLIWHLIGSGLISYVESGYCYWGKYQYMVLVAWFLSLTALWSHHEYILPQVNISPDITLDDARTWHSNNRPANCNKDLKPDD